MNARWNNIVKGSAFVLALCAGTAWGDDNAPARMVILDRNLQRIAADLEKISPSTIQYTDQAGRSRSIDRARVLAVFSGRGHTASLPSAVAAAEGAGGVPGVLRLTDGQVVPGFLVTAADPGENIGWRSRRIGQFSVPLERAASILLADVAPDSAKPQRDTAILGNSDRVEGFIEGVGRELTIEVEGKKQALPIERVAWIGLANPPEPGAFSLVYLNDGTALAATELASTPPTSKGAPSETATAQWALASGSGTGVVDLEGIDAILFDPRAIVPLAGIAIERTAGLEGRRWTPAPEISAAGSAPLGLASITLSGPAQVEWKLPQGCTKFGAVASLPAQAAPWGNATVAVFVAGANGQFREVAKADLSDEKPGAEVVADVNDARVLRIEVRGKAYSDVQARVILQQPVVLRKIEAAKK